MKNRKKRNTTFILTTPRIKAKIGLDCVYPWDTCALFTGKRLILRGFEKTKQAFGNEDLQYLSFIDRKEYISCTTKLQRI